MFKTMKQSILFIFLSLILGCAHEVNRPSDVVFKYYEALNTSDYKQAYSYLSSEQKSQLKELEYINHHIKAPYKEAFARLIEYELIEEITNKNKATVKLKARLPDFTTMLVLSKSASHLAILNTEGNEKLFAFFKNQLKDLEQNKSVTYDYNDILINMDKENNEWKLSK